MEREKKIPYICLEGLDGSGKSTIIEFLKEELKKQGYKVEFLVPTKVLKKNEMKFLEKYYKKHSFLKKSRLYRFLLYANRSNEAVKNIDKNAELIIGDRGIVTSYIVYFKSRSKANWLRIKIIDLFENKIFTPDDILYIEVSEDTLKSRLKKRGGGVDIDETVERSNEMRIAYKEIMENKSIERIKKTKWHIISGETDINTMRECVLELINNLINN